MTHPSHVVEVAFVIIIILNNQISTNKNVFTSNRTALKSTAPARFCPPLHWRNRREFTFRVVAEIF